MVKLAKSDFTAKSDESTPPAPFKSAFVALLEKSNSTFWILLEGSDGLEKYLLFHIYVYYLFYQSSC